MTDEFAPVTRIHIHEDDWGMRSLHPLPAAGEVAQDLRASEAANIANRAPDGIGWTEAHEIAEPDYDYAAAGLTYAQADAVLAPIMPRVRQFISTASAGFDETIRDPLGTYESDAYCYAASASCFIKLDGEGPLVERIWYQAETSDPAHLTRLQQAIIAVDLVIPSIIADYWLDCTAPVADGEFLDRYMRMLAPGTDD